MSRSVTLLLKTIVTLTVLALLLLPAQRLSFVDAGVIAKAKMVEVKHIQWIPWDKCEHIALASTIVFLFLVLNRNKLLTVSLLFLMFFCSELLQGLLPTGRAMDITDFAANLVGMFIGLTCYLGLRLCYHLWRGRAPLRQSGQLLLAYHARVFRSTHRTLRVPLR